MTLHRRMQEVNYMCAASLGAEYCIVAFHTIQPSSSILQLVIFARVCILLGNLLFSPLIVCSVFSDYVVFYGDTSNVDT